VKRGIRLISMNYCDVDHETPAELDTIEEIFPADVSRIKLTRIIATNIRVFPQIALDAKSKWRTRC